MVNRVAVLAPDLKAGVAYYGAQPPADQVPAIRAPLLLHYAGLDQRINAGIPAYEAALKAAGKRYTIYVYPNVNHAFNNDTSNRYDKPAAELAWSRTIAFFKEQSRRAGEGVKTGEIGDQVSAATGPLDETAISGHPQRRRMAQAAQSRPIHGHAPVWHRAGGELRAQS